MDDLAVEVIERVRLWPTHAALDGRLMRVKWGAWAVYVPARQLKLLHAVGGCQHCISPRGPKREAVLEGRETGPNAEAWAAAFRRPVVRRVAENWVMFDRLHRAGLGPEPLGLVVVRDYRSFFSRGVGPAAGLRVADLNTYPEKTPATEAELRAAGIVPDRTLASIREQIRGYVSDLNNLYGAMPLDGEAEVEQVEAKLRRALEQAG
ncbi:hypothetical protein [Limimaricola pyoseonensis]|uniref:Uncharacterized protein n=1 Tax=Limimaricola pyoseonensis TaxID=521013 RepID=A0A1G7DG53_9RHOB|nr:hypothetical protein [Limimaricola pyoseonensis]SDE50551.1 hypothetical protein SAMN04488567_1928 [Limimaricola pyoseonensis]